MTDNKPTAWTPRDDIHLEVWKYHKHVAELANSNAVVHFARDLLEEEHGLDDYEMDTLETLIDVAIDADKVIQKHFGENYVAEYVEQIDEGNHDG